jgi:cytochrome P450
MIDAETSIAHAHRADVPPHVPPDCIVDVDIYRMPGSEHDFLAPWKALQDTTALRVVWTPRNGGHWIVLRGRDIARIYADHANFSSRITIVPRQWGEQYPLRPTTLDPPAHQPYRRVLTAVLSRKTVGLAEPHVRMLAAEAAERLRLRGRCEFVADFAAKLPLALFAHLAQVPTVGMDTLPRYSEDPIEADGSALPEPVMDRFAAFLRALIAERRKQPGDDLISALIAGTVDGRPLDEDESVELATAVMTGGLDTVVSTLGLMVLHLAQDTALRRRLAGDSSSIPAAVTEMLRRFPIMTKARLVLHDQEMDDVHLKAGDMVVLPPLHGLDGEQFEDALRVDPERKQTPHSTFGNGVHRCPGALLAQTELEIMLCEWLARVPEFALDPARPPTMQGGVLGAVLTLNLRWDAATTRTVP